MNFKLFTAIFALLLPVFLTAQTAQIYGTVTSENDEPLVGASVLIAGTTTGTVTDLQGKYSLQNLTAGASYELIFSYLGYETMRKAAVFPVGEKRQQVSVNLAEKSYAAEEVIVSATRAGENAPFAFTDVDEEKLEERNLGQDMPYLLRYTPSAVVTSDAGTGIGYTGIRIRGVEPTGINVTINGIPVNDSESQGVFWVNMPDLSSSTSSVQVQRGVGTSTNGAGAFGATINIGTANPDPVAFTEVNGSVGSFGTLKGNVQFGSGMLNDKFSFEGRASSLTSDGYIDRASVDLNSYFLTAAYHGEKDVLRLNHFAGHEVTYQAWNGVPLQYGDDPDLRRFNSAGTAKPGEPHDNEVDDYTQKHYQLLYGRQLSRNLDANAALHYTRGFGFFELYEGGANYPDFGLEFPPLVDTVTNFSPDLIQRRWLDNHFYGATYNVTYRSDNQKISTTLGGAWNRYIGDHYGEVIWARYTGDTEQGNRYYDNTGEKTDFNIYSKTNFAVTPALNAFLDVQYRALDYRIDGIDNTLLDITQQHTYNFVNPKVGLNYNFAKNLSAYASFAVANREPNRSDFTDAGDTDGDGITDIPQHETLYDTEIGVRKAWKNAALNVNFYYMDYENALVPTGQLTDVGSYVRTNVPEAYRAGVEVVGGAKLSDYLEFNGNLTLSQNRIASFTEYIDNWDTGAQDAVLREDTDLALSPSIVSGAEMLVHLLPNAEGQDLTFSLANKFVGKQFLDNSSNEDAALPSYWTADTGLRYTLRPKKYIKEVTINFLVRNFTSTRYSAAGWIYRFRVASFDPIEGDPYGQKETDTDNENQFNLTGLYPQAPANFLLGVKLRF